MNSPFKLHTRFRGWNTFLAISLAASTALNFGMIFAWCRMADNLSTPRIVVRSPDGVVLPVAASVFHWNPTVAQEFLRIFLPILYTFGPTGTPPMEMWSPFMHPQLLRTAEDRFHKNQSRIESEGLNQTLFVREVRLDADGETATVAGELRLISRTGQITRTPVTLTVELTTTADPLNPYGHAIINVR
jgi:hypothetical protein